MLPSYVLTVLPADGADEDEGYIQPGPVEMGDLDGVPIVGVSGPRAKYAVREYDGPTVLVTTNNRSLELPVNQPVAVSGLLHVATPEWPIEPRALDLDIDIPKPYAGWVRAEHLRHGDGVFWEPVAEGLRWIDLVMSVERLPSKARKSSRLQILTAPTYFVAATESVRHGLLVSGTLAPELKQKNDSETEAPKGTE